MNAKRKEKALKEYGHLEGEQLLTGLAQAGYSAEEINELTTPPATKTKTEKFKLSDLLDRGNWEAYQEALLNPEKYPAYKMQQHVKVQAKPVFSNIFNSHLKSVRIMTGISLVKEKPLGESLISPLTAATLNAQIATVGEQGGVYYLIKDLIE